MPIRTFRGGELTPATHSCGDGGVAEPTDRLSHDAQCSRLLAFQPRELARALDPLAQRS